MALSTPGTSGRARGTQVADLSKIRVGDKLRIYMEVLKLDPGDSRLPVKVKTPYGVEDWLSCEEVEAAEHVPAPKTWTAGQWVIHTVTQDRCTAVDLGDYCGHCEGTKIVRRGLVCNQVGGLVAVFFQGEGLETVDADDLEAAPNE